MPTLNWIGKDAVVNHDKEVPFRLLKKIKSISVGEDSQNLIIKGDNLEGLKALMPYYHEKIKCIYIDPPYNTGNENWVYNDKVNSPKIKKWLGKVVGGEAQDLCRHDKWLCMMYPRLKLLRDLLSEDGVIFISIDDYETNNLRILMDELFGEENFIAQIVWRKRPNPPNDSKFLARIHEYILVFRKTNKLTDFKLLKKTEEQLKGYKNPDNDSRGLWKPVPLSAPNYRPNLEYPIKSPSGQIFLPTKNRNWGKSKEEYERLFKDNRIWFGSKGNMRPMVKRFISESSSIKPTTIWYNEFGSTTTAGAEMGEIFGNKKEFDTPKPVILIKNILSISTNKEDIILDSFAGSGTTGHAVLDLNKEDGGNRKFILIEMEDDIAKKITAERIKRAIEKYEYKDGFEYCELDKPLFNEGGQIEESCDFNQFANYIYFTETQTNIDKKEISNNFIGEHNEVEYYLIYKEKLKNVLSKSFFKKIKKNDNKKVIYADKCLIDEDILNKYNIQFKQIPYEVKVY